jgi:hypothetical protein
MPMCAGRVQHTFKVNKCTKNWPKLDALPDRLAFREIISVNYFDVFVRSVVQPTLCLIF